MPAPKGTKIKNPYRRKPGVKNKITRSAKEAWDFAFQGLGGAEGLTAWGRRTKTAFYKIYARHFLPTTVAVEVTTPELPTTPVMTLEEASEVYRAVMGGDPLMDISQIEFAAPEPREAVPELLPEVVAEVPATIAPLLEVPAPAEHGQREAEPASNVVSLWERLGQ